MTLLESMVAELDNKLGGRTFYTLSELKAVGFFGSLPAARIALKEGRLSFLRISPRRYVIPRAALFEYLKNNIHCFEERSNNDKPS